MAGSDSNRFFPAHESPQTNSFVTVEYGHGIITGVELLNQKVEIACGYSNSPANQLANTILNVCSNSLAQTIDAPQNNLSDSIKNGFIR